MNKLFIGLTGVLLTVLTSCNSKSNNAGRDSLTNKASNTSKSFDDSIKKQKAIDAQMALGDRPDSEQEDPSQSEERQCIANNYVKVERIDTTLISGTDSLHLILKYYCLTNSTLTVPKSYEESSNDFVTHPFATNIVFVNGKDTVLNKQFKATDFNPYFTDNFDGNLKKYGSILLMPILSKENKDSNRIVLAYSIAIPTTDIGKEVYLTISKKGEYKVVEHL
ncbi:hypothetical protein [Mucilaginibacter agri]|uniref:Lipoprotein n=1 Tax=Mucilaginibacter agri TaxID=2695265 RepID=A0A965ZCD5_9SPHI|nr:hypothetical protein [Mucilaginibacter agri]NCD68160.1 hypothetical protein [Mucilaginibacter agri]